MGRQPTFGIRFALVITISSITTLLLAGCSTVNEGGGGTAAAPTTSTQTLEYYPYQVKGYQNSYPKKTIEILMPADARDTTGAAPLNGNPAIGVVIDQSSNVTERLYSSPLGPTVQQAIDSSNPAILISADGWNHSEVVLPVAAGIGGGTHQSRSQGDGSAA